MEWQPIETAPKDGREQILLKVPYNQNGVLAWSNTWWISGFSAENKPTHWKPAPPSNAELRWQPQEMLDAMQKIAEASEKSAVAPRRDITPDDAVWLNIYCSVANCFNAEKHHAVEWADAGLAEFKKRFTR